MLRIKQLKVCHRTAPVGLDEIPSFGWILESDRQNVLQTAYQLTVSTNGETVWDSGKAESRESIAVLYEGAALKPRTIYHTRLTVWDNCGKNAEADTTFETGMLDHSNFRAKWITHTLPNGETACPVFVKRFDAERCIRARLYASACGIYDAAINGKNVSQDFFAPGWTNYRRHLQYQTYDVTDLLEGSNKLELTVAPGWYAGYLNGDGQNHFYGDKVAAFAELHLWYADGSKEIICTDESWMVTTGPVQHAEFYHGETVDSTAVPAVPIPAVLFEDMDNSRLAAQQNEPVQITERLKPIALIHTPKGETVLDFGQNLAGVVALTVDGIPGQKITLRHAEALDKNGNFYTENLRTARATDTFICKGGKETFRPRFTYHGFRYVTVEGLKEIDLSKIHACVLRSGYAPTASFECSNELVNRLWSNICWGMGDNFVDIPTDCPQRDERLGWTGDAAVFSRTACHIGDTYLFFKKWLADLATEQSRELGVPDIVPNILGPHGGTAVWADSAAIVPWNVYQLSGDANILKDQYDSIKMWVDFLRDNENGSHLRLNGFQRGDWLALDREEGKGNRGATDAYLIASAFYAHSTWILAQSASVLGKAEDAAEYSALYEAIREDFRKEFITETGRIVSETQTACALILCFDLCRPEHRIRIAKTLADNLAKHGNHLTTGFIGTPYLCRALTENGYHDLAGKLLLNEGYPGWLRDVKLGATTIWERWDSMYDDGSFDESGMNSFNHYSFGAIGEWMMEHLAGIQAAKPGYRDILLEPRFVQGLTHVKATRETPYGTLSCGWKCKNGEIIVDATIPVNTTATLHLPEQDAPVSLGSGSYHYAYPTATCLEPKKYSMDTTMGELAKNPLAVQLLEQAMPGASQMLGMAFLQSKTIRELLAMSPPGSEVLYHEIIARLNEAA